MKINQGGSTKDSATDFSEPDSEVKLWGPVIALVIAILVIPIIWLLIARWLGGSIVLTGDASGLLATIGGVMGAIFTVGGLIIALVAILTQISLKDRIDRVTQKAIKKVIALSPSIEKQALAKAETMLEEKYDTVLRLAVERQVNQQIKGHLMMLDAQEAMKAYDWEKAESITKEALQLYPKVSGARSRLALWMSDAVLYTIQQEHGITDVVNWAASLQRNRRGPVSMFLPPMSKAIEWLEEAVKNDDNLGEQCLAILTLFYGVRDGYQKLLEQIKTLKDNGNIRTLDWLVFQQDFLLVLLHGCQSAPDPHSAQKDVLDLLGYPLPTLEEVRNSFRPETENTFWVVIGQPKYWAKYKGSDIPPNFPRVVTITGGGETDEGIRSPGRIFYPFWHRQSETLATQELINELSEQFLMVCPEPQWWVLNQA